MLFSLLTIERGVGGGRGGGGRMVIVKSSSTSFFDEELKSVKPPHDRTNNMVVRPAKAQSEQSLRCPHEESLVP